jgi:hypothetical protein
LFRVRIEVWVLRRKHFFSEEKKQKTFYRLSGPLSGEARQPDKSFLVLFFKKELLALGFR